MSVLGLLRDRLLLLPLRGLRCVSSLRHLVHSWLLLELHRGLIRLLLAVRRLVRLELTNGLLVLEGLLRSILLLH